MAESPSQTAAEIRNRFHLIFLVPFIVLLTVRECNGLTNSRKADNPAINGNNSITNKVFELKPKTLKSFGLFESRENISGFDADFKPIAMSNGKAPIVLDTIRTTATITKYLQKLFFPENVDSRWFMVKLLIRIQRWHSLDS